MTLIPVQKHNSAASLNWLNRWQFHYGSVFFSCLPLLTFPFPHLFTYMFAQEFTRKVWTIKNVKLPRHMMTFLSWLVCGVWEESPVLLITRIQQGELGVGRRERLSVFLHLWPRGPASQGVHNGFSHFCVQIYWAILAIMSRGKTCTRVMVLSKSHGSQAVIISLSKQYL